MNLTEYRLGSKGAEVRRIQEKLRETGLYRGAPDGDYGGGTAAAVRRFQAAGGLNVDGVVGPLTWAKLFAEPMGTPRLHDRPLDYRCLALTGSFETGAAFPDCFAGLSGDFDGQGLSFGVLQWNIGQGTLQPLLEKFCAEHNELARLLFFDRYDQLTSLLAAPRSEQLVIVRAIQDPNRKTVMEPWRGMFKSLGRSDEFQRIQTEAAAALYREARRLAAAYGLWSQRGVALMFDIKTQNGSIAASTRTRILSDFARLSPDLDDDAAETARLRIIANRRAEAAAKKWVEDVRQRKLCIANGSGTVHGIPYDLEGQFGIGLSRV